MWREPSARALPLALAIGVLVPGVWGCNVAIGAGIVAVAGGAGYLASQCYDQVRVRVLDETGERTCDADVTLSEGGSVSSLRPCYHASLTEGRWRVTARRKDYEPASTELVIPEHEGACPHYTHSVELTLRRVGSPSQPNQLRPASPPAPAAAAPAVAPAPASVPSAGADPSAPPRPPTATFQVAPAPGAPAPAAPAAPALAAPAQAAPTAPAPPAPPARSPAAP